MKLNYVFHFCIFSVFLGMVTSLPPDFFSFLSDLQRNLCRVIKFVGRIDHDFWRSFMNERKTEAMEVSAKNKSRCSHGQISSSEYRELQTKDLYCIHVAIWSESPPL